MSSLRITLFLLAGAAVQALLPAPAFTGSLEFPLLTGLLIYLALHSSHGRMIYASLLAGVVYDALSPAPLGSGLPFFLIIGAGAYALRDELFADQLITYAVLGLAAVALKVAYFSAVLSATGLRPLTAGLFLVRLSGGLLFGALIVPAVYLLLSAIQHALPKSRRRYS
jgi:rod shape-determining protein MreD